MVQRVAVLGAGTMGSGIAQLAATRGYEVAAYDVGTDALERGLGSVEASLARFVRAERMTREEADAVLARLTWTSDSAAVGGADVVVESVVEDLVVKQDLLDLVVEQAPANAIIGTNTSQLSITAIAGRLGPEQAGRVIGMHFFNPPVLMRLVELTRGLLTSQETTLRAREFAASLDREVVLLAKDMPGFITTRISGIIRMECLRILEEGVASAEDIDKACTLGLNLPMGPLALGDFNGLDTYLTAMDSLADSLGERYRAPQLLRNMVTAGLHGRKAGQGFYRYDEEGRRVPETPAGE